MTDAAAHADKAPLPPEKSLWLRKIEAEPQHSRWFLERFRTMRAEGKDIAGEARFVDAIVPRQARIFDAGCGSGRTGGPLAERGHTVVGVDVDPTLIAAAREDFPAATWITGDLAELDSTSVRAALADAGAEMTTPFDAVVAAGNVMPFLAPSTRRTVLTKLRELLTGDGRAALGFGAGRGYLFADFFADAAATGWRVDATFRGWNLLPFTQGSEFLVVLLSSAQGEPGPLQAVPSWALATGAASSAAAMDPRLRGDGRSRLHRRTGSGGTGPTDSDGSADPMGGHSLRPI